MFTTSNNNNRNNLSSLENVTFLFNKITNLDKNDTLRLKYNPVHILSLKCISKLLNDLTRLLNDSDYYDMEIKVGGDDDDRGGVEIFKAHSTILKARSSYFEVALSNNWTKRSEDGNIILFEKKNISPKIFEVLLM